MKKVNLELEEESYGVREAVKTLRTNIQFCGDDKQVIALTSCLPGEGKTCTALDIARSFAEMNRPVILIDADMRKSVLASRLQIQDSVMGLSHFLSGQCTLAEAIVSTSIPKLHLLMSGPMAPNPTELLETNRFKGMVESLRKVYDYIIIDCPPMGLVIDPAIIARQSDGIILVVESAKTKYRLAQDVKAKLEYTGCPVLGVVLNKVERGKQKGYYSKYYGKEYKKNGYGSYYGEKPAGRKAEKKNEK
ncbi:MAG TPA: CpsD/CapB family tyrosine-protein kinase [Candidatus Bariatricus faecipullorum]|nr:CpsD/CapB family tyrosine-protein kinase [Candidatus Bariatricus faecipullorum]